MSTPDVSKNVSRSHDVSTQSTIGDNSSRETNVLHKKSQLKKAVGDFNENHEHLAHTKDSLLSNDDDILHIDRENQGKIITDTKHKRWSFTQAVLNAFSGWFKKRKKTLVKKFKKPIPQKIVTSSRERVDTIRAAARHSALADTSSVRTTTSTPSHSLLHSALRTKSNSSRLASVETAPRWKHIEPEKPTQPPSTSNPTRTALLESKEQPILIPEHTVEPKKNTPTVLAKTWSGSFHTTKFTSNSPAFKTQEPATVQPVPQSRATITSPTPSKPETRPQETKVPPVISSQTPVSPPPVRPKSPELDTPTHLVQKKNTTARTIDTRLWLVTGIVTATLVLVVIAVFIWNTTKDPISSNEELTQPLPTTLVHADSEVALSSNKVVPLIQRYTDVLLTNNGFTQFKSTTNETFVPIVTEWSYWFARGTTNVELGAFDTKPYIAIQTTSSDIAQASMLTLESDPPPVLSGLFGIGTNTRFKSQIINDATVRVAKENDIEYIAYYIREDGLILIATDTTHLSALIDHTQ